LGAEGARRLAAKSLRQKDGGKTKEYCAFRAAVVFRSQIKFGSFCFSKEKERRKNT